MLMTDRELADTIVASLGYKLFAGGTDKRKVELAAGGVRRPPPSNREALVAWVLYLRGVENPPAQSPLAPVWQHDAVYTTTLGNFGEQRHDAWQAGFRTVYAQLLHAQYLDNNVAHLDLFRNEGWEICGWGTYGYGTDPEQDGRDAAALVKQYGLAGWRANGEAWAEAAAAYKTAAFLKGWDEAGAPCPLGWSVLSSDTANFARSFDYVTALKAPGADIDIQVYGASHPLYTVSAGLGMLAKAEVPVARTTMTFDITPNGDGPFADYRTWGGPRRVFVGEYARAGYTFQQLAR